MAGWQAKGGIAADMPQIAVGALTAVDRRFHTRTLAGTGNQVRMARAGHPIGDGTGPAQAGHPGAQAMCQRAEGAGHRRGIDDGQYRQVEDTGQLGRRGLAVVQAHHALDDDQVGIQRGLVQAPADVVLAGHPQVQIVNGMAAGQRVPCRIQKIRARLENAHGQPIASQAAGQRSHHGGLAVAGGGRGDQQRRRMTGSRTGRPGRPRRSRHTACRRSGRRHPE